MGKVLCILIKSVVKVQYVKPFRNRHWRINEKKEIVNIRLGWPSDGVRLRSTKHVEVGKIKDKN